MIFFTHHRPTVLDKWNSWFYNRPTVPRKWNEIFFGNSYWDFKWNLFDSLPENSKMKFEMKLPTDRPFAVRDEWTISQIKKKTKSSHLLQGCSGPVRSGSRFCFSGPGSALRSGSYRTRTDPVRVSKFFRSGFSPPVRVSYFSGPGLSGPGSPTIFVVYNYLFSSYLSLGSMLDWLVLKNAADCTGQRLKRTSGARVMTFLL